MKRNSNIDIFDTIGDDIVLNERLLDYFEDKFISNINIIEDTSNDVIIIESKVNKQNLENYLREEINDSVIIVIIETLKHETFKDIICDRIKDCLLKTDYDEFEINKLHYEHNGKDIKLIISCVK